MSQELTVDDAHVRESAKRPEVKLLADRLARIATASGYLGSEVFDRPDVIGG